MPAAPEAWRFSEAHLSQAIEAWQLRENPNLERVQAFYEWCVAVTEDGPADSNTMPVSNTEDAYVSYLASARVFVSYLAVTQDRSVFVQAIEGVA